jgi:hypothetical protein
MSLLKLVLETVTSVPGVTTSVGESRLTLPTWVQAKAALAAIPAVAKAPKPAPIMVLCSVFTRPPSLSNYSDLGLKTERCQPFADKEARENSLRTPELQP